MAAKYQDPPQHSEIKEMIDERLRDAAQQNGEKVTIEWRSGALHLPVISMPVEILYFNPDTHRIRAQRSLDAGLDEELNSNPWGLRGQQYLDRLLKCQPSNPDRVDPDFETLRDDIEVFGQKDPGIIDARGILVNGNTRCAALRELGEQYIRVGVLPSSAQWSDIHNVELSLQLRKEHKREYSYINRLIAIEELIAAGRRPEDIARDFRIKTGTLEQSRWVYGVIRDAIQRSRTAEGDALRLVDFEDHQEKLRELHRAYVKTAANDPEAAEALKESRLAMIVLGYAKTDVRFAQPDFHVKYLESKLDASIKPITKTEQPITVPGLGGMTVPGGSVATRSTKTLTDTLLKAKAAMLSDRTSTTDLTKASAVIDSAKDSFTRALKPAGRDFSLKQKKLAAPERLSDACDDIELCASDLATARATRALDEEAFDDAVIRLKSALESLATQASKSFPEPAEGVSWLVAMIRGGK